MKIAVLLALLTVSECGSSSVVGRTGQNITLSCKYDKHHGALSVCWGRGELPNRGCNNLLISTDGQRVKEETRASSRYQLLGRLHEGDVSLTILNVSEADSGRYGCRVEIPGLFNDDKHHTDVTIERGPAAQTTTSTTFDRETSTEQTTANHTAAGQVTSTESLPTSPFESVEQESSSVTVVLVFVLFGLVALVTAGAVVIIVRKWSRLNKLPQQQQNSSDQFNPTSSTLQLHSRGSAVENIYQIDGGGDGGEYEYCP